MEIKISENIKKMEKLKHENVDKYTDGFKSFLTKQSIIPLALGIIIGQTTKDVVNSLVSGILTPLLALILSPFTKDNSLQNFEWKVGESTFLIGQFVSSLIEMLLIMLVIYVIVGVILRQSKLIGVESEKTEKTDAQKSSTNLKTNKKKSKKK